MSLNEKEKKQLKEWVHHESGYKDKKGRFEKGVTIGNIIRDSGHSNDREVVDVSVEITQEKK
jgi:hypothetical protein